MDKHNFDKTVLIRLQTPVYDKFKDACYSNYKQVSEVMRELIQRYIKENEKNE